VSLPRLLMLVVSGALPLVLACGGQGSSPVVDAGALDAGAQAPEGGVDAAGDAANESDAAGDAGDAGDAAGVVLSPPLPSWSEEAFPDKRSPMPKKDEWKSAPRVAIDGSLPETLFRSREGGRGECETRRLREWIQIRCNLGGNDGGVMLIGGNADGVSLGRDSDAIFPVRRGDRRVIEFFNASETVNAHTTEVIARQLLPGIVISEHWIAGDERPTLVASDHAARPR
jgi:hypothetical protein